MVDWRKLAFCFFITTLLFGCDASDSGKEEEPTSNPEIVVVGETVALTATTPTMTDDNRNRDDLVFLWEFVLKPVGSTAGLTDPESAYTSFVPDFQGTYILKSSVFYQKQLLSENEIEVEVRPQEPATVKPENHIASNEICNSCHLHDRWAPATVDHNQVIGRCGSCHKQPVGHIRINDDCSVCHDSMSWAADRARLMLNRALWETSNIPAYQFTYRCSCLSLGDVVITVSDGEITEAYYVNSGAMIPTANLPDLITISKLFAVIDDALQSDSILTVNYNIQYGYPEMIIIDGTDKTTHSVVDFHVVSPPQINVDQVQLNENMALWRQAGINDYQYTYSQSCFLCDPQEDIVVVVNAGEVLEAYFTPSGTPLSATEIQTNKLRTMEQLFAVIQAEIDRPAAELSVTYNGETGYPEVITVDPFAELLDDQYSMAISDLQEIVTPPSNPAQTLLDEHTALWQQAGIADYQFTYRISCFLCDPQENIVVVVNAGEVAEAYFTPSGTPLSATEIQANHLRTVEQLFAAIQAEIDRPAARLSVTYNATAGYPEVISVDPSAELFDDQYTIAISDFQKIVTPPPNQAQSLLDENMALWRQAGIADYQFTYRRSCFCPPHEDVVIVVKAGVITEAFFAPSGTPLSPAQMANLLDMDKLFAVIQDAIDNDVAVLNVTYNAIVGYPESVYIDYVAMVVDEEVYHTVLDFQSFAESSPP